MKIGARFMVDKLVVHGQWKKQTHTVVKSNLNANNVEMWEQK